jgi:hypothetical protein
MLQMIAVTIHPPFGDVATFPWKRSVSTVVADYNECRPLLESLRQAFAAAMIEFDWAGMLYRLHQGEEEASTHGREVILRVLLQLSRSSQEFSARLVK